MMNMKIKEWNPKPLTIGLWRPYKVEVGFIEDYIKREQTLIVSYTNRSGYENDKIILY